MWRNNEPVLVTGEFNVTTVFPTYDAVDDDDDKIFPLLAMKLFSTSPLISMKIPLLEWI